MRLTVTDRVAYGLSVGLSVTVVSPAKMAEPIEMPFWVRSRVGTRSHVLHGGSDAPMKRGNFVGKGQPIVKFRDAVTAPIECDVCVSSNYTGFYIKCNLLRKIKK